jgi:hypothetical protein
MIDHVSQNKYEKNLDILMALISYLALASWRSRTPDALFRDLGLPKGDIASTLHDFPGLFRKSKVPFRNGEYPYTLHARYAKRRADPDETDRESNQYVPGEELDAETLRALLDFVTQQARAEQESYQQRISRRMLLIGVFVAAVASIAAAIISLYKPGVGALGSSPSGLA